MKKVSQRFFYFYSVAWLIVRFFWKPDSNLSPKVREFSSSIDEEVKGARNKATNGNNHYYFNADD